MAARRITIESGARLFVLGILIGLPLAGLGAWWQRHLSATVIHAHIAELGGWQPADLTVEAGAPLRLRLTSDDVVHGFAIGQSDLPEIEVAPGKTIETTLTFDKPGKYVFYCTRWCGLGHWRMRGTIEVTGSGADPEAVSPPAYVDLGINLDAPHDSEAVPQGRPSARRGESFAPSIAPDFFQTDYYRAHSPVDIWKALKAKMSEAEAWDATAYVWEQNTTRERLAEGQRLYAANCTACHGETGRGDGVAASALASQAQTAMTEFGRHTQAPADFTDARRMLGASPALLQGKIIRGGMGTGMPYWGPIFTDAQTWAVVEYLYTFQFEYH